LLQLQNRQAWWRLKELPDWIDAQMDCQGITATAAIAQLDAMKATASAGSRPLGTNALGGHVKRLRVGAAKAIVLAKATPTPASALEVSFRISAVCTYCILAHISISHLVLQIMFYPYHCHLLYHHHHQPKNGEAPLMVVEQRLRRCDSNAAPSFMYLSLHLTLDCKL
jgi:hypothetical protein